MNALRAFEVTSRHLSFRAAAEEIGVTQSGGSRYESGRNIPRPVQALLRLVHIEQVDISKIKKDDVEVVEYLKSTNPELFKTLKKEARAKKKERVAH